MNIGIIIDSGCKLSKGTLILLIWHRIMQCFKVYLLFYFLDKLISFNLNVSHHLCVNFLVPTALWETNAKWYRKRNICQFHNKLHVGRVQIRLRFTKTHASQIVQRIVYAIWKLVQVLVIVKVSDHVKEIGNTRIEMCFVLQLGVFVVQLTPVFP